MFYIRETKGKYQVYHDALLLATFRNPKAAEAYLSKSKEKVRSYSTNSPLEQRPLHEVV